MNDVSRRLGEPYLTLTRAEWSGLGSEVDVGPAEMDLDAAAGLNVSVPSSELAEVYVPLSRLLRLHAGRHVDLVETLGAFLGRPCPSPFMIGLAGSVAVGKSTLARALQALIAQWPGRPAVALVATDGFLFPNATLAERGLLERKGFPESYDQGRLVRFLTDVKADREEVRLPVYSHELYDIVPGEYQTLRRPDVVVVEGLNVLQAGHTFGAAPPVFVSDFFDFSVYLDASPSDIERWFVERLEVLRHSASAASRPYLQGLAGLPLEEFQGVARQVWRSINGKNLEENIAPTRRRATVVLHKGPDHAVEAVSLRRP